MTRTGSTLLKTSLSCLSDKGGRADSRERLGAVLGEHGDEDVEDVFKLRLIGGRDINEDVPRLERDLGAVRVDLKQGCQRRGPDRCFTTRLRSEAC